MPKNIKRAHRLLPRLVIAVTGLALFIGGLSLSFIQKRLVADAGESLTLAAEDIAEKLDWFLFERAGDVQVLARTPVLRGADPEAMATHLRIVQQASTAYVWLAVTDRQGRIVASTETSSVGSDRSHAGWFQAARDGLGMVVGDVEPLSEAGGGMDVVAFTAPMVSQQGQFIGVVTARVTLTRLEEILTRTLRSFRQRQRIQGVLEYQFVTREGLAFVDSDLWHKGSVNLLKLGLLSAQLSRSGQSGFVEEKHLRRHVPVITGYASTMGIGTFRGLDWRVLVRADRAEILAPVVDVVWRMTAVGLIILGPIVGLMLWTIKRVRIATEQVIAQLDRFKEINRVSRVLNGIGGRQGAESVPPACLQLIIETAVRLTGAGYGAVAQFDESGRQLVQFITTGMDEATKNRLGGLPTGRGLLGFLAQREDVLRLKDLARHPAFSGFPPHHPPMRSFLGVPIRVHDRVLGRIYLTEKRGADEFSEIDEEVIVALAAEAGMAIETGMFLNQIQTAELLYRTTMSALPVSVARLDLQGTIQFVNPCFCELIQQREADIVGRPIASVLYSEGQLDEIGEMLRTVRAHGKPVTREVVWIHPTGSRRVLDLCAAGMKPAAAAAAEFVLTVADITERKRADTFLCESEEKFRQLAETIQQVFWMTPVDKHRVLYVSPAYEKIWGMTCESLYASPLAWVEAVHPDDRERVMEAAFCKQVDGTYCEEYRIVRPDGSMRWILDRAFPVRDELGAVYRIIGVAEDITDRKQMEEQLRHSQKMEALGQLAGSITHDFNNLLTIITGNSQMVLLTLPPSDPQFERIQEIRQASERAAALTHQLLAFSRKQIAQQKRVNINVVIAEIEAILRRLLGKSIELVVRLETDLDCVKGDIGQIEQVILNLVVNARDAMPEGGQITIETANFVLYEAGGHQHPHLRPGSYVLLVVGDNGTGMDEATQARIFEPFFTTKSKGKGTGLGLATVHGIVEQSGGHIEIHSQPGRGTTFTIFLPKADGVADEVYSGSQPHTIQKGDATILLVEDEDSLRSLVGDILRSNGYTVLEAGGGDKALQVSREYAGAIHLLLTDMIMPDMNGDLLHKRLAPMRPDMKVLFMSGYTDRNVFCQQVAPQGGAFLQKPFMPPALLEKVQAVLASSEQGTGPLNG